MNDSEEDVRNYADRRRLKSAFLVIVTDIKPRGVYLHFIVHFIIYLFIYSFVRLRRRYKLPGTDQTLCWIASLNYTVQHLLTVRSRAMLIISPSSQVTHLSDFALSVQVFKPSLTGCYCIWGKNETTVAQRCNPNMKYHEVKKVPGGESLIYSYDVRWMFLGPVFVNWTRFARYIYDLFMLYAHCIFIIDEQLVKLLH